MSEEDWRTSRIQYEGDPSASFAAIAKLLGVSKQMVHKKATQEGWQKSIEAREMGKTAAEQVSTETAGEPAPSPERAAEVDTARVRALQDRLKEPPNQPTVPMVPSGAGDADARLSVVQEALEQRKKILKTHRSETNALRSIAYVAMRSNDIEGAKVFETLSRGFDKVQNLERRSYALDEPVRGQPVPTAITVNRSRPKALTLDDKDGKWKWPSPQHLWASTRRSWRSTPAPASAWRRSRSLRIAWHAWTSWMPLHAWQRKRK
ncbi:hypothetical protein [Cupriavidus sp. H19C3]|uniref:hypothetical protein n=1 Tax=Cupriavidus sp. H19C3 TaxID=3241603 RepID=UPI003BF77191